MVVKATAPRVPDTYFETRKAIPADSLAQFTVSAVLTGSLAYQGADPQARQILRHRAGSLSSARSPVAAPGNGDCGDARLSLGLEDMAKLQGLK